MARDANVFLAHERFRGKGFNLNGIQLHPDGYLLVAKKSDGSLFKVPLDNPAAFSEVKLPKPLIGTEDTPMTRTTPSTRTSTSPRSGDEEAIRSLIRAQFDSLDWAPGRDGDWLRFEAGFLPAAQLFGAKRPARPQSARDFTARLKGLRDDGVLKEFSEKGIGCEVHVVGSVAVAVAGCEMTENGADVTRDVSMFLLVRNPEGWRIAAQAWDVVEDIPSAFASAGLRSGGER